MDHHRQVIRMGTAVILIAIFLRLFGGGFFRPIGELLQNTRLQSFLIYLQTGRIVRLPETVPDLPILSATNPTESQSPENPLPVFSAEDLNSISVSYLCDYRPDLQSLITSPLSWDLTGPEPTVLIIHTHATEAYTQTPTTQYVEDAAYRTLDERYNMVSIGEEVKRVLEAGGIRVLHDRSYHDYPSYNGSYGNARISIEEYLQQYPSIQMVIDIHRDASDGSNGTQLTTSATVGGQESAQMLVVVGTDAGGNYHPEWQKNLSLALKLHAVLERADPGITRPVSLRSSRFNMDLTAGSILMEVGAAGDTHEKATIAANALGRAIVKLAKGTQ